MKTINLTPKQAQKASISPFSPTIKSAQNTNVFIKKDEAVLNAIKVKRKEEIVKTVEIIKNALQGKMVSIYNISPVLRVQLFNRIDSIVYKKNSALQIVKDNIVELFSELGVGFSQKEKELTIVLESFRIVIKFQNAEKITYFYEVIAKSGSVKNFTKEAKKVNSIIELLDILPMDDLLKTKSLKDENLSFEKTKKQVEKLIKTPKAGNVRISAFKKITKTGKKRFSYFIEEFGKKRIRIKKEEVVLDILKNELLAKNSEILSNYFEIDNYEKLVAEKENEIFNLKQIYISGSKTKDEKIAKMEAELSSQKITLKNLKDEVAKFRKHKTRRDEFSYSQVNGCGKSYTFEEGDRDVPISVNFEKGKNAEDVTNKLLSGIYEESEVEKIAAPRSDKESVWTAENIAYAGLQSYRILKKYINDGFIIEQQVKVQDNDIIGYIDYLLTSPDKNRLLILDMKTTNKTVGSMQNSFSDYEEQVSLYAYLLSKERGININNIEVGILFATGSTYVKKYQNKPAGVDKAGVFVNSYQQGVYGSAPSLKKVEKFQKKLDFRKQNMDIKPNNCKTCSYVERCEFATDTDIELFRKNKEEAILLREDTEVLFDSLNPFKNILKSNLFEASIQKLTKFRRTINDWR
jgi:predicted Zn-ribbon and HTH transcriptional regulator